MGREPQLFIFAFLCTYSVNLSFRLSNLKKEIEAILHLKYYASPTQTVAVHETSSLIFQKKKKRIFWPFWNVGLVIENLNTFSFWNVGKFSKDFISQHLKLKIVIFLYRVDWWRQTDHKLCYFKCFIRKMSQFNVILTNYINF